MVDLIEKVKPFDQQLLDVVEYVVRERGGYLVLPFIDTPEERAAMEEMNEHMHERGFEIVAIARWALESGGPLNGLARVRIQAVAS